MLLEKFKFYVLGILLFTAQSQAFEFSTCITEDYEAKVSHKSAPFGLTNTHLAIQKEGCTLVLNYVQYDFMKNRWEIDVCRGPVHIKSGSTSVDVIKREKGCPGEEDYCEEVSKIFSVIQNHGLIFAPGEKEDLKTDHGKFYCAFELLKSYLEDGIVLSKNYQEPRVSVRPHLNSKPQIDEKNLVEEEGSTFEEKPAESNKQLFNF